MYHIERSNDGWCVKKEGTVICTVSTEREARHVAMILELDAEYAATPAA